MDFHHIGGALTPQILEWTPSTMSPVPHLQRLNAALSWHHKVPGGAKISSSCVHSQIGHPQSMEIDTPMPGSMHTTRLVGRYANCLIPLEIKRTVRFFFNYSGPVSFTRLRFYVRIPSPVAPVYLTFATYLFSSFVAQHPK